MSEDFQTCFTNGNVVGRQLESESNIEDEEEIMKIDPIPPYLIYDGFEKIDAAMV